MRSSDRELGMATLVLPMLVWLATLCAIAVIDVGAYLVAAARAQSLADHTALAAASSLGGEQPIRSADAVAVRGGGQLEVCDCDDAAQVSVRVSVPVPGLVIPRLGAARVVADATAAQVRP